MTGQAAPPLETVSVRDLTEFTLRSGDLGGDGSFQPPGRALAGTRAHQQRQRSKGPGWELEVFLRHPLSSWLHLMGRVDALCRESRTVEEIKTYTSRQAPAEPDQLHVAQAKFYAWMLALDQDWQNVTITLCYLGLRFPGTTEFSQTLTRTDLEQWAAPLINHYLSWAERERERRLQRDLTLASASFPFGDFRPGQRRLSVAIYRAIRDRRRLFAEAPTGIGKTISALFPAAKALGEGHGRRIFYLTAKTIGRTVALDAAQRLRQAGADLRCIALTARDKICLGTNGTPCDRSTCPYALGYYNRNRKAVDDLLRRPIITRDDLREVGEAHQVCPFELGLDASLWCDLLIGDVNYVLDPSAYLRRFFDEGDGDSILLFDEAHNLVDRAREMFSAVLVQPALTATASLIRPALPSAASHLYALDRLWRERSAAQPSSEAVWDSLPDGWLDRLEDFLAEAASWLALNEPAPFRDILLQTYFDTATFLRVAAAADENYTILTDLISSGPRIRLYCLDPSKHLDQALGRGRSSIFFSATLSPADYFIQLLGGSGERVDLPSPFPPENVQVLLQDQLPTHFSAREQSLDDLCAHLLAFADGVPGHVLVFFPSFQYLEAAAALLDPTQTHRLIWKQTPSMDEPAREAYLAAFQPENKRLVLGLAVMGGIFGEGIDLAGNRLLGVAIVGVGLPQLCLDREQIRVRFETLYPGQGFDFAYRFPGWNRVLQACGRLIRSPTDRGTLLLIDRRYRNRAYTEAFPSTWHPRPVRDPAALRKALAEFWSPKPAP